MSMVVCKTFFCILCRYQQFKLLKRNTFWQEITLSFQKNNLDQTLKVLQYQIWIPVKTPKKQLLCNANFNTFSQISYSNFGLQIVLKTLELLNLSNKLNFKRPGVSYKQNSASREKHGENMNENVQFPSEIAR